MNQLWFEDMMSQTYNEDICFNPTKLLILYYLAKDGIIHERYKIYEISEYVYRVYIDNMEIASKHPSYMIRKIHAYGVKDIQELVYDTLVSWCRDAKNNILGFNDSLVWLDIDISDGEDIAKSTIKLSKMLYRKIFKGNIPIEQNVTEIILAQDDHDLEKFGQGKYRDRVLEDMQYCPLCEDMKTEHLYAVHILEKTMGATPEEICNKKNGLILCRKHAELFLKNEFYFDERGFAHKISSCEIEKGMHLSFSVRTRERQLFLKRRQLWSEGDVYG